MRIFKRVKIEKISLFFLQNLYIKQKYELNLGLMHLKNRNTTELKNTKPINNLSPACFIICKFSIIFSDIHNIFL